MTLAPIVLFTYNRPFHTRLTIEALKNNLLAKESELYIFSDASKTIEDETGVNQVRSLIRDIKGFKNIKITERERNYGLADNIIDGVNYVVNIHKKIIVLEDDLLTSPLFLSFINKALTFYKNKKRVMHISGWNYPINTRWLPESFLWRVMNCWGWSTWADRWQYYDRNVKDIIDALTDNDIYRFNLDGTHNFWYQVLYNSNGKLNTWATFWYVTIFMKNGLCLNPTHSYVKNIGLDGTGEHLVKGGYPDQQLSSKEILFFPDTLSENKRAVRRIKKYLKPKNNAFVNRFYRRIKRYINKT